MSIGSTAVSAHCPSLREYFSVTNMKSMARGFIYDYETPKIVTIHSISSKIKSLNSIRKQFSWFYFFSCADVSNNSIIDSNLRNSLLDDPQKRISRNGHVNHFFNNVKSQSKIKWKWNRSVFIFVWSKGIGYNQTTKNQTLVIDGAGSKFHRATVKRFDRFLFFDLKTDYIVPPQENNALFLMTNFIRTDQEHRRCAGFHQKFHFAFCQKILLARLESIDEKQSACLDDDHCRAFGDFPKVSRNDFSREKIYRWKSIC